jgi:hypothetical protein
MINHPPVLSHFFDRFTPIEVNMRYSLRISIFYLKLSGFSFDRRVFKRQFLCDILMYFITLSALGKRSVGTFKAINSDHS